MDLSICHCCLLYSIVVNCCQFPVLTSSHVTHPHNNLQWLPTDSKCSTLLLLPSPYHLIHHLNWTSHSSLTMPRDSLLLSLLPQYLISPNPIHLLSPSSNSLSSRSLFPPSPQSHTTKCMTFPLMPKALSLCLFHVLYHNIPLLRIILVYD